MPATEITKLNGLSLAPGMPVKVFSRTANCTMLSYLIKPLSDQIERAFREE